MEIDDYLWKAELPLMYLRIWVSKRHDIIHTQLMQSVQTLHNAVKDLDGS